MITKIRLGLFLVFLLSLFVAGPVRAVSYTLTVVEQGSGTISTNPTFATYPANVTVGLTATPSVGWYFGGWSGAVTATTNPVNVTMTGDLTVTGLFLAYPTYSLTLTTNGQGSITLNPTGGTYYSNTMVTATATPAAGWVFVDWSDATNATSGAVSLALDSNLALSATFAQLPAFDVPPQSITNAVGSTVTFTSHSVGTAPVAYQWYFSNEPLTGATNDTLTLADAPATEAGFYQVTATNFYGSVTSSVVALVLTNSSGSTNIVSVCDEAALQGAISAGGWISIGCSGTLTLTNTLTITNNVVLDGSSVAATLSGGNVVRLFYVQSGASLSITNLTLANGSSLVTSGTNPAAGGAIYDDGGTVTLSECTLTNNSASVSVDGTAQGGAIYNNGGTVRLYDSAVLNNTAYGGSGEGFEGGSGSAFGGAIFNNNGSVTIVSTLLQSNLCDTGGSAPAVFGGALFQASGNLFMTNDMLVNNETSGGTSGLDNLGTMAYGGALAATGGTVSMNLCQCLGNIAAGGNAGKNGNAYAGPAFGGAVYCSNSLTAVSCSFSGNQALGGNYSYNFGSLQDAPAASGGAIYNWGSMVLKNCLVYSNNAVGGYAQPYLETEVNGGNAMGGGIFNAAQLAATNCTVAFNTADGTQGAFASYYYGPVNNGIALGGGVFNSTNATFLGVNVTIATNFCMAFANTNLDNQYETFVNGLMGGSEIANTNGTAELLNSLLAYGGAPGNAYGVITDLGDNISSDGSANFNSGSSYNFTDPLLGALANNGGPTLTMALSPDSPAIAYANSDDGAPPDDQRGYARPVGMGVIDLGAYQYGATQIIPPPTLSLSVGKTSTNIVVSFTTSPAITNTLYLQSSTNLINWTDVQTIGAFSSPSNISQTINVQGMPEQFFRLTW